MIHHIVLHAFGAKWSNPAANCFSQFFAMGEENQEMPKIGDYGIANMTESGKVPSWRLTHMLMNHRSYPFKVYVRTRITYSDTPKTELTPLWMDTARTPNGGPAGCDVDPTYTVPGGGKKGSNHTDDAIYTVPEDGRIIGAQGHLHGGGRYQTVTNLSCESRRLWRSQAYYAMPDHIFYRVRPILHEPSPVSMSRTISPQGIPVQQGRPAAPARGLRQPPPAHARDEHHDGLPGPWRGGAVRGRRRTTWSTRTSRAASASRTRSPACR